MRHTDKAFAVSVRYGLIPTMAELSNFFSEIHLDTYFPHQLERSELCKNVPLAGQREVRLRVVHLDVLTEDGGTTATQVTFDLDMAKSALAQQRVRPAVFEELWSFCQKYPSRSDLVVALGSVFRRKNEDDGTPYDDQAFGIYLNEEKPYLISRLLGGRDWDEDDVFLVADL